jgi:N-acetylglucosamine kinase
LFDGSGAILAESSIQEGTNGYLIGVKAVADILIREVQKLLERSSLPKTTKLSALGACMSGFLEKGPQDELIGYFNAAENGPIASSYYIDNDSPGSIFTAAGGRGGCVIIAGTGCMSQLITPSGETFSCNGHGHLIGDEGSAWFISNSVIRLVFRALDKFAESTEDPFLDLDTTKAREAMALHFGINVAAGEAYTAVMYASLYGAGFNKSKIAGFTKSLADLARSGDKLCAKVFELAGSHLGSFARTLAPYLRQPGNPDVFDFTIVCVGSVWKSWDLLSQGFIASATGTFHHLPNISRADIMKMPSSERGHIASFRLVRLTKSSAYGAAWMASKRSGHTLPLNFDNNVEEIANYVSK